MVLLDLTYNLVDSVYSCNGFVRLVIQTSYVSICLAFVNLNSADRVDHNNLSILCSL